MPDTSKDETVKYLAGRGCQVFRGGALVRLNPGDPIPEAAGFRSLRSYLRTGRVVGVKGGELIRLSKRHGRRVGFVSARRGDALARGTHGKANERAREAQRVGLASVADSGSADVAHAQGGSAASSAEPAGRPAELPKASKAPKAPKAKKTKKTGKTRTRRGG